MSSKGRKTGDAYDEDGLRMLHGDVTAALRPMPAKSVHMVMTSPPYWGLRDYGVKGAIGLEATPGAYLRRMVKVFREIHRVLRDDGVVWMNMGDVYHSGNRGGYHRDGERGYKGGLIQLGNRGSLHAGANGPAPNRMRQAGLKDKDLVGMPWRLALMLQDDGWYLRRDVIWAKPNCMPESATDRPVTAHEYVFLLTKKGRYFYDGFAIREPQQTAGQRHEGKSGYREEHPTRYGFSERKLNPFGRNARSVWTIATTPSPLKHYAMFPEQLAEKCIRAGTSEHGVCSHCGAPWRRVQAPTAEYASKLGTGYHPHVNDAVEGMGAKKYDWFTSTNAEYVTAGWEPGCKHEAPIVPATVLDPFAGMGTTLKVSRDLGRQAIGIEISGEYIKQAVRRLRYGVRGAVAIERGQEVLL